MNIRLYTALVIRRGGEYLVGRIMGGPELRWSTSPWEAWKTRNREDAEAVARCVGGDLWLFNPVAGIVMEVKSDGN